MSRLDQARAAYHAALIELREAEAEDARQRRREAYRAMRQRGGDTCAYCLDPEVSTRPVYSGHAFTGHFVCQQCSWASRHAVTPEMYHQITTEEAR